MSEQSTSNILDDDILNALYDSQPLRVSVILNIFSEWVDHEAEKESLLEGFENTYATKRIHGMADKLRKIKLRKIKLTPRNLRTGG